MLHSHRTTASTAFNITDKAHIPFKDIQSPCNGTGQKEGLKYKAGLEILFYFCLSNALR